MTQSPGATELAAKLVEAGGGTVGAILLYGSHLLQANPDRHSAFDFVVIVDDYPRFYAAMKAAGEIHRPVRLMTWMAGVFPPNVIAFAPDEGRDGIAKCLVVDRTDFAAALGPDPKDHFLLGRMIQKVGTVWTRTPEDAEWVERRLEEARFGVLDWMVPYLDQDVPIDGADLGRHMMRVCYQGELRPEATNRSDRIFAAQAEFFREYYREVLEGNVGSGVMRREGDRFVLVAPATPSVRRRWRRHFARSKVRATTRWLKHSATFDNWLPYVTRKVERHTGRPVELTSLERRLPLIFLWPRVIKVVLMRPAHSSHPDGNLPGSDPDSPSENG